MATTLGGVTLPHPAAGREGCEENYVGEGSIKAMASGATRYQHINSRKRFTLRFLALSAAEITTCETQYLDKDSQVFSPPYSTDTFNVFVVADSWRKTPFKVASGYVYDLEFSVEEND